MDLIKVGKITTTHGIKGEVKVIGDNSCFDKSFAHALFLNTNPMQEVHIKSVKKHGEKLIVGFLEFNDINQVLNLKNVDILADRATLEKLDENEYYIQDLIGLSVYNEQGNFRGLVCEVREYPQSFYLVVEYQAKKHLIPFINEFIVDVSDTIIIKEIEGLFE